jgi:hypothetical protein
VRHSDFIPSAQKMLGDRTRIASTAALKQAMGINTNVTQVPVIAQSAHLASLNISGGLATVTVPVNATEMTAANGAGYAHGHVMTGVAASREL